MQKNDTAEKAEEWRRAVKTSTNVRNTMLNEQKCASLFIKSKNNENSAVKHEANNRKRNTKFSIVVMCGESKRRGWEERRDGRKLTFMFLVLGWAGSSLASSFYYLKYK